MAQEFDVIVVGAGFAGMHMLWKLRGLGMSTLVVEKGSDVGGTWYWNRYPGCRCDVPSLEYSVPWDPEADQEWNWSERYSAQPEIFDYAKYLADRHDLRKDIRFHTTVTCLTRDDERGVWVVETANGDIFEAAFVISAAGALSTPHLPNIPGIQEFQGELHHTGMWPTEPVALAGKRVAVLGTGSTGVQASTAIAAQAEHLYVLQRTAQFSIPCHNPPLTDEERETMKSRYPEHRAWQRNSYAAQWTDMPLGMHAFDHPKDMRLENYEKAWNAGRQDLVAVYADIGSDADVAAEVSDFARQKIRQIVNDPATAEKLCPLPGSYIGTRRIIMDTGYFEIFNQPNVTLVDIREDPIEEMTAQGIRTGSAFYEIDMLVVATGYDAVTGPLLAMNVTGKGGVRLNDVWADGPHTYLGLMVAGFPNLFTITGPSSPGVLANVIFSIDQHVNWIGDCLEYMRRTGAKEIDTTPEAQEDWREQAYATCAASLRLKDENNWYLGTNIPGKPRSVLVYQGGLNTYKSICDGVAADGYKGFVLTRARETQPG